MTAVLEERVQPVAVREPVGEGHALEGRRLEVHEEQEEGRVREHRDTHPGHERAVLCAVEPDRDRGVGRQHPAPEQERSRLPAPRGAEPIVERHRPRRMRGDIGQGEVVVRQGPEERQHRDRRRGEDEQHRAFRDPGPVLVPGHAGEDAGGDAEGAEEESQQERVGSEVGHGWGGLRVASACAAGRRRGSRAIVRLGATLPAQGRARLRQAVAVAAPRKAVGRSGGTRRRRRGPRG